MFVSHCGRAMCRSVVTTETIGRGPRGVGCPSSVTSRCRGGSAVHSEGTKHEHHIPIEAELMQCSNPCRTQTFVKYSSSHTGLKTWSSTLSQFDCQTAYRDISMSSQSGISLLPGIFLSRFSSLRLAWKGAERVDRQFSTEVGRDDAKPSIGANDRNTEAIRASEYYRAYEKLFSGHESSYAEALLSAPSSTTGTASPQMGAGRETTSGPCTISSSSPAQSSVSTDTRFRDADSKSSTATPALSHVDEHGKARMIDVGEKPDTIRIAVATCRVRLPDAAFQLVAENRAKKGDVLGVARLAGIAGAKRTSDLIPLCHNIMLTGVKVDLELEPSTRSVRVSCKASTVGRTGVEMEALTGASVAALTVYDMCKAASHHIVIEGVRLTRKTGGRSGEFRWDEADDIPPTTNA